MSSIDGQLNTEAISESSSQCHGLLISPGRPRPAGASARATALAADAPIAPTNHTDADCKLHRAWLTNNPTHTKQLEGAVVTGNTADRQAHLSITRSSVVKSRRGSGSYAALKHDW